MPMQENQEGNPESKERERERETMGRTRMEEARCKRHPKHQLSKGVCPFCLRERLSGLLAASSSGAYSSSSSLSSSAYSSDSELSSLATTPPCHDLKRTKLSLLFKAGGGDHGGRLIGISEPLTKSRSLAFPVFGGRRKEDKEKEQEEKEKGTEKKKKRRFWSKLFGRSLRSGEFGGVSLHSRTLKEKSLSFV